MVKKIKRRRVPLSEPVPTSADDVSSIDDGGTFFSATSSKETFGSGSTLLDLANGGGWAVGGVINIVGDKSSDKTGLIIEAFANFERKFPGTAMRYNDAEKACDTQYAQTLGLPSSIDPWQGCETVEKFADDFVEFVTAIEDGGRGLYVLDSLDALSDETEMAQAMDAATMGMAKAKMLSKFFRKTVSICDRKRVTLIVVSQIRAAVNVSYGRATTRAGGKALDFYALQIIYLTHLKRIEIQRRGVKRCIGIQIQAKNEKNKVGPPFREARFPVYFSFGVDDVASMIEWLLEIKQHRQLFASEKEAKGVLALSRSMDIEEWVSWRKKLRRVVRAEWDEIEQAFAPTKRKY